VELDDVHFTMIAYETYASIGIDFKAGLVADLKAQGENLRGAKRAKLPLAEPLIVLLGRGSDNFGWEASEGASSQLR
jgi:hypothetical protein